jgi:hypothetical protein
MESAKTAAFPMGKTIAHCKDATKTSTIELTMNEDLLDEPMKAQLRLEWERVRKALSQAGDIGPMNLEDWRIVAARDRRAVPPAISVLAVQALIKLEKSGPRGHGIRGGEQTTDATLLEVEKAQSDEVRLQDADHSEVYAAIGYYAGRRLGLSEQSALVLGDSLAYLLTGWGQSHTDDRYTNQLILEFKKSAGTPPEGGFLWSQLHSLTSRKGFRVMAEKAGQIGTALFR